MHDAPAEIMGQAPSRLLTENLCWMIIGGILTGAQALKDAPHSCLSFKSRDATSSKAGADKVSDEEVILRPMS